MSTSTSPTTVHRYFVSFFIAPHGFGHTEVSLSAPIRGMDEVRFVADMIARHHGATGVTVLYFTALSTV